jgi:sulfide:quinone oxidoreductase
MKLVRARVLVLGAGFGGLELCTLLSEGLGAGIDVTLIDKNDAFVFGFSKLDILFGKSTREAVRLCYKDFIKPGVQFRQEKITAIDPIARRLTTDAGRYDGDVLVVALGAAYDFDATPGLAQSNEFYSVSGAERLSSMLPDFVKGRAVIGACGAPYKCPPAPSEAVLLLHDYLSARGVRKDCDITLVLPLSSPVPPSPDTSRALLTAFAERDIHFVADSEIRSLDCAGRVALLDDGTEIPYDLFLGVPSHRAPKVVVDSGMTEDGYVPVNPKTLKTRWPGVYAIGDCARQGTPKAGVFAEGAARTVAASLIRSIQNGGQPVPHAGTGSCYIEFGAGRIGRVDIDFLSGSEPTGTYHAPSVALRAEKEHFGASRRARWFVG